MAWRIEGGGGGGAGRSEGGGPQKISLAHSLSERGCRAAAALIKHHLKHGGTRVTDTPLNTGDGHGRTDTAVDRDVICWLEEGRVVFLKEIPTRTKPSRLRMSPLISALFSVVTSLTFPDLYPLTYSAYHE